MKSFLDIQLHTKTSNLRSYAQHAIHPPENKLNDDKIWTEFYCTCSWLQNPGSQTDATLDFWWTPRALNQAPKTFLQSQSCKNSLPQRRRRRRRRQGRLAAAWCLLFPSNPCVAERSFPPVLTCSASCSWSPSQRDTRSSQSGSWTWWMFPSGNPTRRDNSWRKLDQKSSKGWWQLLMTAFQRDLCVLLAQKAIFYKNTPKSYSSTFIQDAHKSYNNSITEIIITVIPHLSKPWDSSRPSTNSPVIQKEFLLEKTSFFFHTMDKISQFLHVLWHTCHDTLWGSW